MLSAIVARTATGALDKGISSKDKDATRQARRHIIGIRASRRTFVADHYHRIAESEFSVSNRTLWHQRLSAASKASQYQSRAFSAPLLVSRGSRGDRGFETVVVRRGLEKRREPHYESSQ